MDTGELSSGRRDQGVALDAEEALVRRAIAGDRDAFASLYRANVAVVFSFLRFRVGETAAEDLTGETFLKAWKAMGSGYEWRGTPFRAWLLRIAYHEIVRASRRRSATEVVSDELEPTAVGDDGDSVLAATVVDDLQRRLRQLSPAQATVVELRYLRELSVAETAVVLDLTEEAVRALAFRAMGTLRRLATAGGGER